MRTKNCPLCGSVRTGINKLPNGHFIIHCDESCGAIWESEVVDINMLRESSV